MIDVRDLVFPMTAGDLVVSACIVRLRDRGTGAEIETSLLEVLDVDASLIGDSEQLLELTVRDQQSGEIGALRLKRETPVLVTRIARS